MYRIYSGVRIIDVTRGWVGGQTTRVLADLGAEVIKVERPEDRGYGFAVKTVSGWRYGEVPPPETREGVYAQDQPGREPWNAQGAFHEINRNKRSIALRLDRPAGRDLFLDLASRSHVVIENFSPRVMGNLGLEHSEIARRNWRTWLVSMPGIGTGSYLHHVTYGLNLEALSGFSSLFGYEENLPQKWADAYPDFAVAIFAAMQIQARILNCLDAPGRHLIIRQFQAFSFFLGDALLAAQSGTEPWKAIANTHPLYEPHGMYPCLGADEWVAITVTDNGMWHRLADYIGEEWAALPHFGSVEGRKAGKHQLDRLLGRWTAHHEKQELAQNLQLRSVAATPVLYAQEVRDHPTFNGRRFFWSMGYPDGGRYPGFPFVLDGESAAQDNSPAPSLSQDCRYVLQHILGRDQQQTQSLFDDGVVDPCLGPDPAG